MRRYLHLHDTPQVSKLSRDVSNQIIIAKISIGIRGCCHDMIQVFYFFFIKKYYIIELSLRRCSKLPVAEGIEPPTMLQDKSLQIYQLTHHIMRIACLKAIAECKLTSGTYNVSKFFIFASSMGMAPLR